MYQKICFPDFEMLLFFLMNLCLLIKEIQAKDVHFTKSDCDAYRHYLRSSDVEYQVVWDGEPYPRLCSLRFANGYAGLDDEWHICAEITDLYLECGKSEVVYSYYKSFTCKDRLPIKRYCDTHFIYIKLLHFNTGSSEQTNARVRIKVTRVKMEKSDSSGTNTLAIILPIMVALVIFMITVTICVYKKRQRILREQMRDTGGVVVLGRRGDMVMMGVPANRANDMMAHAANQYRENPNRPYLPPTQNQQHPQTYTASHNPDTSSQSYTTNAPPSYNEVVYQTKS